MIRSIALLIGLSVPAVAQVSPPQFQSEMIPTDILACNVTGMSIGCLTAMEERMVFCMAVDEEGEPVANSTYVSATGVVTFQNVDAARIDALLCRPR